MKKFIASDADDVARIGNMWVFVHRWDSMEFDPFAFARAKLFLKRITRLVKRAGYKAEPFDPLSPEMNLPQLGAKAGLGNLTLWIVGASQIWSSIDINRIENRV